MTPPIFLAHGTLGWADEIIFAGVTILFLGMMLIHWAKTRTETFDDVQQTSNTPTDATPDEAPDRFRMD